jgi:hypothetical protein
MNRPIELKGVIQGTTIILDEETFLPDGYRVTLHVILEPGEIFRIPVKGWSEMTPEQVADLEATLSDFQGHPFKLDEAETE